MSEKVTVVISAYNEGSRIEEVLKPLIRTRKKEIVDEIIVVDDGSTDDTVRVAGNFNIHLISLGKNRGKGAAMAAGVQAAKNEIILFLDADLVGLKESHIVKLLHPIVGNSKIGMSIGLFRRSGFVATTGNMLQLLSGQRAVRKSWVKNVSGLESSKYGADALITKYGRKHNVRVMKIYLDGLHHVYKEKKNHFLVGFFRYRMKMYAEIMRTLAKSVE